MIMHVRARGDNATPVWAAHWTYAHPHARRYVLRARAAPGGGGAGPWVQTAVRACLLEGWGHALVLAVHAGEGELLALEARPPPGAPTACAPRGGGDGGRYSRIVLRAAALVVAPLDAEAVSVVATGGMPCVPRETRMGIWLSRMGRPIRRMRGPCACT